MAKDIIYPRQQYGTVRKNKTFNLLEAFNMALQDRTAEYQAMNGIKLTEANLVMWAALNGDPRLRQLFRKHEKEISKYQPSYLDAVERNGERG